MSEFYSKNRHLFEDSSESYKQKPMPSGDRLSDLINGIEDRRKQFKTQFLHDKFDNLMSDFSKPYQREPLRENNRDFPDYSAPKNNAFISNAKNLLGGDSYNQRPINDALNKNNYNNEGYAGMSSNHHQKSPGYQNHDSSFTNYSNSKPKRNNEFNLNGYGTLDSNPNNYNNSNDTLKNLTPAGMRNESRNSHNTNRDNSNNHVSPTYQSNFNMSHPDEVINPKRPSRNRSQNTNKPPLPGNNNNSFNGYNGGGSVGSYNNIDDPYHNIYSAQANHPKYENFGYKKQQNSDDYYPSKGDFKLRDQFFGNGNSSSRPREEFGGGKGDGYDELSQILMNQQKNYGRPQEKERYSDRGSESGNSGSGAPYNNNNSNGYNQQQQQPQQPSSEPRRRTKKDDFTGNQARELSGFDGEFEKGEEKKGEARQTVMSSFPADEFNLIKKKIMFARRNMTAYEDDEFLKKKTERLLKVNKNKGMDQGSSARSFQEAMETRVVASLNNSRKDKLKYMLKQEGVLN